MAFIDFAGRLIFLASAGRQAMEHFPLTSQITCPQPPPSRHPLLHQSPLFQKLFSGDTLPKDLSSTGEALSSGRSSPPAAFSILLWVKIRIVQQTITQPFTTVFWLVRISLQTVGTSSISALSCHSKYLQGKLPWWWRMRGLVFLFSLQSTVHSLGTTEIITQSFHRFVCTEITSTCTL